MQQRRLQRQLSLSAQEQARWPRPPGGARPLACTCPAPAGCLARPSSWLAGGQTCLGPDACRACRLLNPAAAFSCALPARSYVMTPGKLVSKPGDCAAAGTGCLLPGTSPAQCF